MAALQGFAKFTSPNVQNLVPRAIAAVKGSGSIATIFKRYLSSVHILTLQRVSFEGLDSLGR
jgi:hypothetical protein